MADESVQADSEDKRNSEHKTLKKLVDKKNCLIKKRNPLSVARRKNDVYVSNRTNFKSLLKKCEKLYDSGESEVLIHGLGAAISKACSLALKLQKNHNGTVELDINTSTVELTDDIVPLNDDEDFSINKRQTSAIHIRAYKTVDFGSLKYAKETKT